MKKIVAIALVLVLALSAVAFAEPSKTVEAVEAEIVSGPAGVSVVVAPVDADEFVAAAAAAILESGVEVIDMEAICVNGFEAGAEVVAKIALPVAVEGEVAVIVATAAATWELDATVEDGAVVVTFPADCAASLATAPGLIVVLAK